MADAIERSVLGVALALVAATEVPAVFSVFVPSLYDVSDASKNNYDETCRWVRRGETNAFALSIAIGTSASLLSKSWLPLLGTLMISGFIVYHYEAALKTGDPAITEVRDDT